MSFLFLLFLLLLLPLSVFPYSSSSPSSSALPPPALALSPSVNPLSLTHPSARERCLAIGVDEPVHEDIKTRTFGCHALLPVASRSLALVSHLLICSSSSARFPLGSKTPCHVVMTCRVIAVAVTPLSLSLPLSAHRTDLSPSIPSTRPPALSPSVSWLLILLVFVVLALTCGTPLHHAS